MPIYRDNELYVPGLVFEVKWENRYYREKEFQGNADPIALIFNPETHEISEHPLGWFTNGILKERMHFYCIRDTISKPEHLFHTNRFLAQMKIQELIKNPRTPLVGKEMVAIQGKNKGKKGKVVKLVSEWAFLQGSDKTCRIRVHNNHLLEMSNTPLTFREEVWQIASDTAEEKGILEIKGLVDLYWHFVSEIS